MDVIIAKSCEYYRIDGLSFKPTKTTSYVTKSKSCTVHPQRNKKYSAFAETKRFKIHISGNSWLDLSTCRIMCGLRNDRPAGKQLRPL